MSNGPFEDWSRPNWDDYFMSMALLASVRSQDPNTKHGCVIVDRHNRIKSIGFNGYPPNSCDEGLPKGKDKYWAFEHSERNAIFNSTSDIEGCTVYITGPPCLDCFRALRCNRVSRIVYGPILASSVKKEEYWRQIAMMNKQSDGKTDNIEIIRYEGDPRVPLAFALEYFKIKTVYNI